MSRLPALLMLAGLALGPATEAATWLDTRPVLWAEAQTPREPWANLTLVCWAQQWTTKFQLLKDEQAQDPVNLSFPAVEHRFPLGAVTSRHPTSFRCRSGWGRGWTPDSEPLDVAVAGSLAAPTLRFQEVSWVTPQRNTTLICRAGLRGVTFLLQREGDDEFLETAKAPKSLYDLRAWEVTDALEATFPVHQAGYYSCSYRTHMGGPPSQPSDIVVVEELAVPPAPTLRLSHQGFWLVRPGDEVTLDCWAPLAVMVLELRLGVEVVRSKYLSSSTPGSVRFHLGGEPPRAPVRSGNYTCRYWLEAGQGAWSADSEPLELLVSRGPPPAPELQARWKGKVAAGKMAVLSCRSPLPGVLFELLRAGQVVASRRLEVAARSSKLALRVVGPEQAGHYRCRYHTPGPRNYESEPSAPVEIVVAG